MNIYSIGRYYSNLANIDVFLNLKSFTHNFFRALTDPKPFRFNNEISKELLKKIIIYRKNRSMLLKRLTVQERIVELPRDIKRYALKSSEKNLDLFFLEVGKSKVDESSVFSSTKMIGIEYFKSLNIIHRIALHLFRRVNFERIGKQDKALRHFGKTLVYDKKSHTLNFDGINILNSNFTIVNRYFKLMEK